MKTRILTICFLLLSIIGARAENVISLSSASGHPGDEVTLQVDLTTTDAVTAAEVVIPLDKQLTYVDGSATLNSERADGHQLSAAMVDGALRIYVYSLSLKPLKGNEGTLATFRLKLKKEPADYSLVPQIVLSDATGKELQTSTQAGCVTLLSPKLTVETTRIDYGHIPIRTTYTQDLVLQNSGNEPLEITDVAFSAAEFFSNEKVFSIQPGENKHLTISYAPTVRGAVEETVTITSNAINGVQKATLVADPFSVNELHVEGASGNSDTEVEIALRVNNMEPLVGAQCTFTLPDVLKYVEGSFTTSERTSNHTATGSFANGKLTLILYSTSNIAFTGNDGVIGTFKLKLDGNSGWYSLEPESVVLSNITMENMTSVTEGAGVTIQSPSFNGEEQLTMGSTAVTTPVTALYTMNNHGDAPLTVSKVTFLAEGYTVKTALPLVIEPWQSATLSVEYTPTKEGAHGTTMNIYTNDPQNRMKAITVSGTVYEPNGLTLEGENQQDGTYQWTVGLNNYTDIVAVQMDIHWLQGMITSLESLIATDRLKGHTCTIADMGDGVYRVIIFSMNNSIISGNEGTLFTLTYTPKEGINYQDTDIHVKNIVLSDKGGTNYVSESNVVKKASFTGFWLKFVLEGNTLYEEFVRKGTAITAPEVSTKEGYTFSGWGEVSTTMPAKDVTFEGTYTINQYTLLYMVDGKEYKKVTLDYGTAINAEAEPTKEGHSFSGWSEKPETMPAKDVTITGTFTANSYKVTYMLDGELFKTEEVVFGTAIPTPYVPAKEGYNFSGWGEIPTAMPAKDITLNGSYTINKDLKFDLVYFVDGVEYKRVAISFADPIKIEEAPTKEGHTFSGWSEVLESMPLHDVTVTGSFIANSYQLTYVLDGKTFQSESVVYGTAIVVPEVPTREGYTFNGWTDVPETMPAKDVTIEGRYSINQYILTYIVDGIEYKKVTLDYGTAIDTEAEPTKEGHSFSGWSEKPETMPAKDVTVEGSFTVNTYTITYMIDGEVYATKDVTYGSTVTLMDAPTKEGYIFSGWSETPKTMPAEDVTVTGTFEVDGINAVISNGLVDVYTLQGVIVKRQISMKELSTELSNGIYIVNGKKLMIK